MLKPFCDICEQELNRENRGLDDGQRAWTIPLNKNGDMKGNTEIKLHTEGTHICRYCLIKCFSECIDNRPRQSAPAALKYIGEDQ